MLSRKICLMFTTLIMISGIMGCNVKPAEETSMSSVEVSTTSAPSPKKVGISMPTKALACWRVEGFAMKQQLEEAGYLVDLRFAGDNEPYKQIK